LLSSYHAHNASADRDSPHGAVCCGEQQVAQTDDHERLQRRVLALQVPAAAAAAAQQGFTSKLVLLTEFATHAGIYGAC
jgi:hypothetical protein